MSEPNESNRPSKSAPLSPLSGCRFAIRNVDEMERAVYMLNTLRKAADAKLSEFIFKLTHTATSQLVTLTGEKFGGVNANEQHNAMNMWFQALMATKPFDALWKEDWTLVNEGELDFPFNSFIVSKVFWSSFNTSLHSNLLTVIATKDDSVSKPLKRLLSDVSALTYAVHICLLNMATCHENDIFTKESILLRVDDDLSAYYKKYMLKAHEPETLPATFPTDLVLSALISTLLFNGIMEVTDGVYKLNSRRLNQLAMHLNSVNALMSSVLHAVDEYKKLK